MDLHVSLVIGGGLGIAARRNPAPVETEEPESVCCRRHPQAERTFFTHTSSYLSHGPLILSKNCTDPRDVAFPVLAVRATSNRR